MKDVNRPIAIFDSGLGGVSFLELVRLSLPEESFIYYGDTAYSPYGGRSREYIIKRALTVAQELITYDIKALVVACNTATGAAINDLRAAYPELLILGMEPAIKPAVLWLEKQRQDGKKAKAVLLATSATAHCANSHRLLSAYDRGHDVKLCSCPGLMELVEQEAGENKLQDYFACRVDSFIKDGPTAIILGCTHYIFIKDALARRYPSAVFFDGNGGTLEYLYEILKEKELLAKVNKDKGRLKILTSSQDKEAFRQQVKHFTEKINKQY